MSSLPPPTQISITHKFLRTSGIACGQVNTLYSVSINILFLFTDAHTEIRCSILMIVVRHPHSFTSSAFHRTHSRKIPNAETNMKFFNLILIFVYFNVYLSMQETHKLLCLAKNMKRIHGSMINLLIHDW